MSCLQGALQLLAGRTALTIGVGIECVPDAVLQVALPANRSLFGRRRRGARHHLPLRLRWCCGLAVCSSGAWMLFLDLRVMRLVTAGGFWQCIDACTDVLPGAQSLLRVCRAQCSVVNAPVSMQAVGALRTEQSGAVIELITSAGATSESAPPSNPSSVTSKSSDETEAVRSPASVDVWPACGIALLLSIIMALRRTFIAR